MYYLKICCCFHNKEKIGTLIKNDYCEEKYKSQMKERNTHDMLIKYKSLYLLYPELPITE